MAELDKFTSKLAGSTSSPKVDASPSPPPIADIHLTTPVAPAEASDALATAAAPSAATSTSAPPTKTSGPTFHSRQELAFLIEAAMWAKYGIKELGRYTQKYRDLAPQLGSRNEELTTSLYLGRLSATDLVSASLISLAPSTLREKREKEAAWNREAARSDIGMDTGATDQFLCDRCHAEGKEGRNCTYFQMQTRGADEPMTIFVTCLDCGNKFRSGDGER